MKGTRPLDNDETGCSGLLVQDSDLPNFRLSDTLYKSSLGWHCYETVTQRRSLPPSHCSKWIKDWGW